MIARRRDAPLAFAALAIAGTIWGASFVIGKIALKELSVSHLMLYRFVFASLGFLPLLLRQAPRQLDLAFNPVNLADAGFAFGAIVRMNLIVMQRNGDSFERPLLPAGIERDRRLLSAPSIQARGRAGSPSLVRPRPPDSSRSERRAAGAIRPRPPQRKQLSPR